MSDGSESIPTGWRCGARLTALRDGLASLLLPVVCVVCGDLLGAHHSGIVCTRCRARVRALREPQCERCGHPVPVLQLSEAALVADGEDPAQATARCTWCSLLPPYVRAARSACWATVGTGGDLVHALKYGGWTILAAELGQRMARLHWPADVIEERAAVVPVPLAPVRRRERGYNQSELLAVHVAGTWGVEVWPDVLERTRATSTQTRLAPEQRAANVAGAFSVPATAVSRIRGMHLVLIDDVATTCATLNECASALFAAGARLISYLTFARAPAASDRC